MMELSADVGGRRESQRSAHSAPACRDGRRAEPCPVPSIPGVVTGAIDDMCQRPSESSTGSVRSGHVTLVGNSEGREHRRLRGFDKVR